MFSCKITSRRSPPHETGRKIRYHRRNTLLQGGIGVSKSWSVWGKWLAGLVLLLVAFAAIPAASAQEVFVIQVDKLDMSRLNDSAYVKEHLSAATQYIRIACALEGTKQVRLKVVQKDTGSVVMDKNYGQVSGTFRSGDIYLKFSGSSTIPYTITLTAGNDTYTFPFHRKLVTLKNNTACTFGVRIKSLDKGLTDAWTMATPLDLEEIAALPGGVKRIDLCASNMYIIGTVTVRVRDGALRVSMQLLEDENEEESSFEIAEQHLFLIASPSEWNSVDPRRLVEQEYEIGTDILLEESLPGTRYVVMYLPVKLSYDPNGLHRFSYNPQEDPELIRELEIWDAMKEMEKSASVG